MAFHHQPLYHEGCSRYPYIGRVSVGEEERVDFIYQFVKKRFVAENHSNPSIFGTAPDIIGTPSKFPIYVMRNDDFDISISPWQDEESSRLDCLLDYLPQDDKRLKENNYIDIEFHEAVHPIRVSIYDVYNSGNVIKIWAQDSDNQWFSLWDGSSQIALPLYRSRLFSPPLLSCNFKTKILRLEFAPGSSWNYHTKLDAVMLIGTSELILSRTPNESVTNLLIRINCVYSHYEDVDNLTSDYKKSHRDIDYLRKNFAKYCIICESHIGKTFYKSSLGQKVSQEIIPELSPDESKSDRLSKLPDEIIGRLLRNSDLCRMNEINDRIKDLTRDPLLYTRLNVRSVCDHTYISNIFVYFTPRCKYLRQLDLTSSDVPLSDFANFLDHCGRHLTHLQLSKCQSVNNSTVLKISKICKDLKELDLSYCQDIDDEGFSHLENLGRLEHLNLRDTYIQAQPLCKILQKNQRMRKLNLTKADTNLDEVAVELRNSCRDLEVINLLFAYNLTSKGINALADCKNLRKVNLQVESTIVSDDSLCRLLSSCQRLEEIYLSYIALTDRSLKLLTQCKNLEQLHLYQVKLVTPDKYSVIFEQSPKLRKFHFISCEISDCLINLWRERYPHVSVYAFQYECLAIATIEAY